MLQSCAENWGSRQGCLPGLVQHCCAVLPVGVKRNSILAHGRVPMGLIGVPGRWNQQSALGVARELGA